MSSYDRYPKPAVAVDIIIICWDSRRLEIPLIRRGAEPYRGEWALPGGFLEIDETLYAAAGRELREETGVEWDEWERGPIYDAVDRDPRGRVLSVPHIAIVPRSAVSLEAGSDAAQAELHPLDRLPGRLAFDHAAILASARELAANEIQAGRLGVWLSPEERERVLRQLLEGRQDDRGISAE